MQPDTASVMRLSLPTLSKIDGRSSPARRAKAVAERLKREINAGRWSRAELDLLNRTARQIVLAEESTMRALRGTLAVADAVKAEGAARRAERHLRTQLERNLAEPKLGPNALQEYVTRKYGRPS